MAKSSANPSSSASTSEKYIVAKGSFVGANTVYGPGDIIPKSVFGDASVFLKQIEKGNITVAPAESEKSATLADSTSEAAP